LAQFLQHLLNGLTIGAFLSLIALGYTMIYGIIRLINFAHGDIFMVGSFLGLSVLVAASATQPLLTFVVVAALLIGMAGTGLLGAVVERVAYQPLLKAPRLAILISALGVSMALAEGVRITYGASFRSYPYTLPSDGLTVAGARLSYAQVGLFALSGLLMVGLYLFVHRTTIGTAMRALAMDRDAARLMGINVERVILITFLLGSVLAGAAGVMWGLYYTQISFGMGFRVGLQAFTAAVLGGIGNIPGAMVAGLLIGLLQSFFAGTVSAGWADAVVFVVLILVLVVKPTGLFGERVVERV
jgi:branched-chain amino acid transport system permease protein